MKRIISLGVALLLILALAGCDEALDLYEKMSLGMSDVESAQLTTTQSLTVEYDYGYTFERELTSRDSYLYTGDGLLALTNGRAVDNGEEFTFEAYAVGGKMYYDDRGSKYWMSSMQEEFADVADALMDQYSADTFQDVEVSELPGGGHRLELDIDAYLVGGDMEEYFIGQYNFLRDPIVGVDLHHYSRVMELDEDYRFSRVIVTTSATLHMDDGSTAELWHYTIFQYEGYNKVDSLEFPDDLDEYVEIIPVLEDNYYGDDWESDSYSYGWDGYDWEDEDEEEILPMDYDLPEIIG